MKYKSNDVKETNHILLRILVKLRNRVRNVIEMTYGVSRAKIKVNDYNHCAYEQFRIEWQKLILFVVLLFSYVFLYRGGGCVSYQ